MNRVRRHPGRHLTHAALVVACLGSIAPAAHAQWLIDTVAGRGIGDGRAGPDASVSSPTGVALDLDGAILVADWRHNRIRRIDPVTGVITSLAGTASGGLGNGGPADEAMLKGPLKVRVAPNGDIFIAELDAHRVRRIAAGTSNVSVVAGEDDISGADGDGGAATAAHLAWPADANPDGTGRLLIADLGNNKIRSVSAGGTITTLAGTGTAGYSGDGGFASAAELHNPVCAVPGPAGVIYICDKENHVLRRIDALGIITTVAGTGSPGSSGDGGPALAAHLFSPTDVVLGDGGIYVTDSGNHRIRFVDLVAGTIETVAGTGVAAYGGENVTATTSPLQGPTGITLGASGEVIFGETGGNRVRLLDAGLLETIAGDGVAGFGGDGGSALDATFAEVKGVATDSSGNLYVADDGSRRIRAIDVQSDIVTTIAGNGTDVPAGDGGPATGAAVLPSDVAIDGTGAALFSDSFHHSIRRVPGTDLISTIAGGNGPGFSGDDGAAVSAQLQHPTGLALDAGGATYVADFSNHRIRRVALDGSITTVAGNGTAGFSGDGDAATAASLNSPTDIAFDESGNMFIADMRNHRIRRVDAVTHVISTFAGSGPGNPLGDGGSALAAGFEDPTGVAIDVAGRLVIADSSHHRIRLIDGQGLVHTIAGDGARGYRGDGGPGSAARLLNPLRVYALADGRILVADRFNAVVRELRPDADADGVLDPVDTCPGTTSGAIVNAVGCACSDSGHVACNDGISCTTDTCDPASAECMHANNTLPCDDGTFCNGQDTCAGGGCVVHAGNPCTGGGQCADSCDESANTCDEPASTSCNLDSDACTFDSCDGSGTCLAGPPSCGDGIVHEQCSEACDHGATNGTGNCCATDCTLVDADGDNVCDALEICPDPIPFSDARLRVGVVGGVRRDRLIVRLSSSALSGIDPIARGFRMRIAQANGAVSDIALPPGTFNPALGFGWGAFPIARRWTWMDRRANPPGGITGVRIAATGTGAGDSFVIQIRGQGIFPASQGGGSLLLTLIFDGAEPSSQCAEASFGTSLFPCTWLLDGSVLWCD